MPYKDPEDRRSNALLVKYGITAKEYDALLAAQGGHCALCLRSRSGSRRLAVDHDHKTGLVRGLLCTFCNRTRLGRGREDPVVLRRCADYLEQGPGRVRALLGRAVVAPKPKPRTRSSTRTRGRKR